tara:strand:- start:6386 stop:7093 length:708 start_codon:yes stop_codon:yes gene_type:complete
MAEANIHLIERVEALYPKLDQTYRYDNSIPPKGKTVPCGPTEENAKYEMDFKMSESQAKELYKHMAAAYKAEAAKNWPAMPKPVEIFDKDNEGNFIGSVQLRGQFKGKVTDPPLIVDSNNKKLPSEFRLTTGSLVNLGVNLVPYNMSTCGVSLRIKAVQVIKLVEKKQHSPFAAVDDGWVIDDEDDPSTVFLSTADTAPVEEDEVPAPKKVSKKAEGAAPPPDEDLASIVDDWDD